MMLKANRRFRNVFIPVCWFAIVLLTAAHGNSKTATPNDKTPHPTAAPSTSAAGPAASRRPADPLLSKYLRFGHLTSKDGLSNDSVWGIAQDGRGFMWFGTFAGLNRYDGSDIKEYHHSPDDPFSLSSDTIRTLLVDSTGVLWVTTWSNGLNQFDQSTERFIRYQFEPENPNSLSNDQIRSIYEDRNGWIWVGTLRGLNKLDPATKQFAHYLHDPDDPDSLGNDTVWSIYEDRDGMLWVGTDGGLDRFDPVTETFVHFVHDLDDPKSLSQNSVRSIVEDGTGTLWVGTEGGLNRFDRQTELFTRYQYDPANPDSFSHTTARIVFIDQAGTLWVGTWGGGLNRYDRETDSFIHYQKNASDPYSINSNQIFSIYEDQTGMVWFATENGGVNFLDGGGKPFRHYRAIAGDPASLSGNDVRAVLADQNGIVWVGTTSSGLNRFDPQTEEFTQYHHDPQDPNSLSNDSAVAIHRDQEGALWVGGYSSGLNRFDPDTDTFTLYKSDPADPLCLSSDNIRAIHEDQSGILWIGTWGGGVNTLDRETGQFTRYQYDPADPASLSQGQIADIYEDRQGVIWISTRMGLNKFDRETGTFTSYQHDPADPKSIASNSVISMYEDRSGRFWVTTTNSLNRFDRESEQFSHYTMQDGLPASSIWGVLEDDQGNLWLNTTSGLSKFNPVSETFRNYDVSDGLQGDSFSLYETYSKTPNGEMFFGGTNGVTAFFPDQIEDNPHIPPVVITDFQLENKPVPIGGDSVLQKSILETDELVLSYQDNVFSFEFVALNYRAPEKNRYRYKVEGFEEEWNEVDITRRFATYTNLDPGDYVFRVIASNNDGIWNEEGDSIKITITPPWWQTTWFHICQGVLVIGLLVGGYRWRVSSIKARSRQLETEVAERTQELQAANHAKSTFLANTSHELRTPLHAILGFSRLLARDPDTNEAQQERLAIINRSGEHLLGMVNDILNLSKIEAGRIELKQETFDVIQMLQDVGKMMKSRAEAKGLQFTLELDPALPPCVQGDVGKLRQVLINLLGNAVKFTETGGVWLRTRSQPMADPDMVMLQLEVEDSGVGIPHDKLDKVFESFVQIGHVQNLERGTGLGLAISKTLADMMNGEIKIESEPGQGSLFKIRIPLQMVEAEEGIPGKAPVAEIIGLQADQPEWRFLVVDDNLENRVLLTTLLTEIGCNVKEAKNGEEAISIFQEWHPHFIWMDMRMPVMDGFAATRKIRTLPGGEEVKIVAVTASVLEERHDEILAAGCDEVVRKPFKDQEIFDSMTRHLGMKYLYKDRVAKAAQKPGVNHTAEMLADLPGELLQELRETTLALNREAALEVIARIADHAPEVATGLKELVDNYQMVELHDLLR